MNAIKSFFASGLAWGLFSLLAPGSAFSEEATGTQYLQDAQTFYRSGQYFKAARYAFAAQDIEPKLEGEAYALVSTALVRARLYHSATYFFIRTLQTGDKSSIRKVLADAQTLFQRVGTDPFRNYLIQHTSYEDYDSANLNSYLYALGKEALLSGQEEKAIQFLSGIRSGSAIGPLALQLRGAAFAINGKNDSAIRDFQSCQEHAFDKVPDSDSDEPREKQRVRQIRREADDLKSRCYADEARTLYQMEKFEEADRAYDRIPKKSFVWPDILFEQAWNSYSRKEYNRTLGKLVSYKSPSLKFVFNTEVDVLRAQTYLALCLYSEANDVINEFNSKYTSVGERVKHFVEGHKDNLRDFYDLGKGALHDSLYSSDGFHRMANRFVRGPYFQGMLNAEREIQGEIGTIAQYDTSQKGISHNPGSGFPGFLNQILQWRRKTIQDFGGAFVKNSLLDYHAALISDFEKMSFIKLEMLKQAKDLLMKKRPSTADRSWGNVEPSRRDDQYFWSFNGEFWNDELGDYVFGLESECGKKDGG